MINGTLEVHVTTNGSVTSVGKVVQIDTPDDAAGVLASMHFTDIAPAEPPAGRAQCLGSWTATAPGGHPAAAGLWRDVPFEETVVGKAIAQAIADTSE